MFLQFLILSCFRYCVIALLINLIRNLLWGKDSPYRKLLISYADHHFFDVVIRGDQRQPALLRGLFTGLRKSGMPYGRRGKEPMMMD
jgi:hypothetical protein